MSEEFIQQRLAALSENGIETISSLRADKAALTTRVAELEEALRRMLLEFDFMVESNIISDVRNDIIFVAARAALTQPTKGGE